VVLAFGQIGQKGVVLPSLKILILAAGLAFTPLLAHAGPLTAPERTSAYPGVLISQFEGNDAYDPFADYSEFEESAEEEADINFFRNGRFFTLGFIGGYRTFTETLGNIYSDATTFGLFLCYFFDLRFALQLQFLTGDHKLGFESNGQQFRGNVSLTSIALNLKYYINTQNLTRGLAQFNPYLIGGFAQIYRTATVTGVDAFSKEGALGFDIGAGVEMPLMRNKMFLGLQGTYELVTFKDENSEILSEGSGATGIYPTGDVMMLLAILGVNF
jgi:hypothetical protein